MYIKSLKNRKSLNGGSLKHSILSKILSIGYEFETGDITKFSLHANQHTLINSDLSLRTLEEKIKKII
jgi:hypothetical protein